MSTDICPLETLLISDIADMIRLFGERAQKFWAHFIIDVYVMAATVACGISLPFSCAYSLGRT